MRIDSASFAAAAAPRAACPDPERRKRAVVGGQHVRFHVLALRIRQHPHARAGDTVSQVAQRPTRRGVARHAASRGSGPRGRRAAARFAHRARDGAHRVVGGAQSDQAVPADQAVRGLQPHESAQARPGCAPTRRCRCRARRHHARGHRHRRAAAGAARHAVGRQVPRVPRRAHQRVGAPAAKRELHGLGLAEMIAPAPQPSPTVAVRSTCAWRQIARAAGGTRPSISNRSLIATGRRAAARRMPAAAAVQPAGHLPRLVGIHLDVRHAVSRQAASTRATGFRPGLSLVTARCLARRLPAVGR